MPINSCQKGKASEREVARILRDHLNLDITRNWQAQSAIGGHDLNGLPFWAPEIKHHKRYDRAWWQQAVKQAEFAKLKPVLIFRITGEGRGLPDTEKWKCEVRASDVIPSLENEDFRVVMPLAAWIAIVREEL